LTTVSHAASKTEGSSAAPNTPFTGIRPNVPRTTVAKFPKKLMLIPLKSLATSLVQDLKNDVGKKLNGTSNIVYKQRGMGID